MGTNKGLIAAKRRKNVKKGIIAAKRRKRHKMLRKGSREEAQEATK